MRRSVAGIVVIVLTLAHVGIRAAQHRGKAPAGPAGDVERGKAVWALGNTSCRNCHGGMAEGLFGPTLAGRGEELTFKFIRDYVRAPTKKMPAYVPSQLTDREIADLAAYFASLPPSKPGPWRTPMPTGAPPGQVLAIDTIGCAQCHGATLDTPRHGIAEVGGDWEWFKRQVYQHTTAIREQWAQLDPSLPQVTPGPAGPPGRSRVRMGNYDRKRLPEAQLREIFNWITDLGYLPPLTGRITAGPSAEDGTTYTIELVNAAVKNKGIAAHDVTMSVALPSGAKVSSATGAGYQGVRTEFNSHVAVWRVPHIVAAERQIFTITMSTPAPTLRSTIRWAKPAVKADGFVIIALSSGARGRGGALN